MKHAQACKLNVLLSVYCSIAICNDINSVSFSSAILEAPAFDIMGKHYIKASITQETVRIQVDIQALVYCWWKCITNDGFDVEIVFCIWKLALFNSVFLLLYKV